MKMAKSDKLILFIGILITLTFLVLGTYIIFEETNHINNTNNERLLEVSKIIAVDGTLIDMVENEDVSLDSYVDRYYEQVEDLSFIVIIDMDSLQLTHPIDTQVGMSFEGDNQTDALMGETYTNLSDESLSAFIPIYNDSESQIGVAVVGIQTESLISQKSTFIVQILIVFVTGIVASLFGLWMIRNRFKNKLFGFSPDEIALLYAENKSIIEQLDEAVISVDNNYRIMTINSGLKERFGLTSDVVGKDVSEIFPYVDFKDIIENATSITNKYKKINDQKLLMNAYPLYLEDEIIGATAILRSHLEVDTLLDQIQGYQQIAVALRSQKHEFQNKLHVVLGLIKMKDYLKAENYIMENVYTTNLASDYYNSRIKDDRILALFVGKEIQSREYNAQLMLTSDSFLSKGHYPINSDDIVLVLGNLIDNSFEAYIDKDMDEKPIVVDLFEDDDFVKITVVDKAGGINETVKDRMFERGVSSKQGPNRGTGLSLVSEIVSVYNGEKNVISDKEETKIEIILEKVNQ